MPAATDLENVLADRLWVLFEAQAMITVAVLPGNRDKGTETGWLRKAIANAPMDRRRLEISFARFRNSLYTGRSPDFTVEDTAYSTSNGYTFDVTRVHEAVITYREPLPADPGANAIKEAIEQTLFLAQPNLGLPDYKVTLGELTGESRETRENENPHPGRITTLRISITTVQSALAQIALTV